jgi:hypothetical protein
VELPESKPLFSLCTSKSIHEWFAGILRAVLIIIQELLAADGILYFPFSPARYHNPHGYRKHLCCWNSWSPEPTDQSQLAQLALTSSSAPEPPMNFFPHHTISIFHPGNQSIRKIRHGNPG